MVLSVNSKDPEKQHVGYFQFSLSKPIVQFLLAIKSTPSRITFPLFPTATVPISLAENLAPPCTQILDYKQTSLISFF
jgi:hypothetical protein